MCVESSLQTWSRAPLRRRCTLRSLRSSCSRWPRSRRPSRPAGRAEPLARPRRSARRRSSRRGTLRTRPRRRVAARTGGSARTYWGKAVAGADAVEETGAGLEVAEPAVAAMAAALAAARGNFGPAGTRRTPRWLRKGCSTLATCSSRGCRSRARSGCHCRSASLS